MRRFQCKYPRFCDDVVGESFESPAVLWDNFEVLKGSRRNLYISWKPELFGRAIEVHFLVHQLISAVLSRGFNHHHVLTGLYRFPKVISSIPLKFVPAGRPSGARNRIDDVCVFARRSRVLSEAPGPQFAKVLGLSEPEDNRPNGKTLFVLDPHRDIGSSHAVALD